MKAQHILSGLGWGTATTAVSVVAQFAFMAVLARQLEPTAFGLMLMAVVAVRFAGFFAQMGATQTLVQSRELDAHTTTAVLLLTLGASLALYLGTVLAAPGFAWYFASQELSAILAVFGLSLPLAALSSLPLALLRRQAKFRNASLIELAGHVGGYGLTGIACASAGLGVWSLVLATLAQHALVLLLGFACVRYPLVWPVRREAWRLVAHTGAQHSTIGFLEFLYANVEVLWIGRVLGPGTLGVFNRAQMAANLPVEQAVNIGTKVLFPVLSSMQTDRARLGDGFLILLAVTGALSAALAAGIAAAAPDVVAVLLGPKWDVAVPVLQIVAWSVPPMFVYVVCGVALDSMGALRPKLVLQATMLVIKVAAVLALAGHGLPGVAAAAVAVELLRAVCGVHLVARLAQVPTARLWRVAVAIGVTAAWVFVAVESVRSGAVMLELAPWARVAAVVLAGATAMLVLLVAGLRRWPAPAALQRFEALRSWHFKLLQWVRPGWRP